MKNAIKKAISVLLAVFMLFGAAPLAGFVGLEQPEYNLFSIDAKAEEVPTSGTCGENLTWELDESTGELVISGTGAMTDWSYSNDVPWDWHRSSIKSVTIGDGVTTIGDVAFCYCDSLANVTIPDSVTSIGNSAFVGCSSLASVTIPDSVTSIGNSAFVGCSSLANITIPDSVTSIGEGVFNFCNSLASITVDSANTVYSSDEFGVLFNKSKTEIIYYPIGNTRTSYIIPDSVTSVGVLAFYNCTSLESVTIPDSVTSIGNSAFEDCTSLASITIPDSVTSIGVLVFENCRSLEKITVDSANTAYSSDECGVLFNKDKTVLIKYPAANPITDYKIPDGVTRIGRESFYGCTNLANVTIPDSVTIIDYYAFYGCTSLSKVTTGKSVTVIGDFSFSNCTNLANINIFDSVTHIGYSAFKGCTSLSKVTIGNRVTSIGFYAFCDCTNLKSITIPDSVTHIYPEAFRGCTSLASVTMGSSVKTIDFYAFYDCTSLADVYYTGIDSQWKDIAIREGNEPLLNAELHTDHVHTVIDAEESVEPTCDKAGYKKGECICGYYFTETVSALNHKDTLVKVEAQAPTCTEIGWDAYEYCTACDYTTYAEKKALDHDIVIDKAVDATCTETGLTEGQHCSRCDDMTVAQEVVPVKPHNYTAKHDSAKHWEECTCGAKINVENHSFVGGNTCSCGFERVVDSAIKIKNNSGSKTINYGETLKLTATVTDKPSNAKIYWYVDGEKKGEGEVFNVKFESGTKIITVKLVDENGVAYQNSDGNEIADTENVTINGGFFQKIISFFKNLFGMNRIVVQIFKGIY